MYSPRKTGVSPPERKERNEAGADAAVLECSRICETEYLEHLLQGSVEESEHLPAGGPVSFPGEERNFSAVAVQLFP